MHASRVVMGSTVRNGKHVEDVRYTGVSGQAFKPGFLIYNIEIFIRIVCVKSPEVLKGEILHFFILIVWFSLLYFNREAFILN